MKLFKSLLVAPAALGLLAPMSATANEITINDFNPVVEETLLAGGEGLIDEGFDGSFSETTSASFSVDFGIGAVDGLGNTTTSTAGSTEAVSAVYGFQIDLTTSFTGEDSLDISIDAGNAGGATSPLGELDLNGAGLTANELTVDGVSYTFPVGDDTTVVVGAQGTDGSVLFTTACTYGGPSNTLDDCGNVQSAFVGNGTTLGASYAFSDEFTLAVGYAGDGDTATAGLMTKEGLDAVGINAAYTTDTYGLSVTYASVETSVTAGGKSTNYNDASVALNGYFSPEGFPSISAGYEFTEVGGAGINSDEKTSFFVGVQFDEVGPGSAGFAVGTEGSITEANNGIEALMYEAYYSYPVNDGMTITPLIYAKEASTATDVDETGIMVKTSFSF